MVLLLRSKLLKTSCASNGCNGRKSINREESATKRRCRFMPRAFPASHGDKATVSIIASRHFDLSITRHPLPA